MIVKITLVLASLLMAVACSSLQRPEDPRKVAEREDLAQAQDVFKKGDFKQAHQSFSEFLARYPTSTFKFRAQIGEAQSLEKLDQWSEALQIYRDILHSAGDKHPEIMAQVLFLSSFCYEALGDDVKTLSALKDAERLSEKLPPEIGWAALPARLAGVYNRLSRLEEAREQMQKAEKGVSRLRARSDVAANNAWLAEIYYSMSPFSTHQLSEENFSSQLDTLRMMQSFSIRSIMFEAEPWSRLASEDLKKNYRNFWNLVKEKKYYQGGLDLLQSIFELSQYQNFEMSEAEVHSTDFFKFLETLQKEITTFVHSLDPLNPLTPEAEKRQSLKKSNLKLEPVEPDKPMESKGSNESQVPNELPQKIEKKDPNL